MRNCEYAKRLAEEVAALEEETIVGNGRQYCFIYSLTVLDMKYFVTMFGELSNSTTCI